MRDETLPLRHFEQIYERGPDPWHFASSPYEAAKYAASLAALPRARYTKGFEVGCSIGVFTAMLADRCDDLLAVEPVEVALDAARLRNAAKPQVRFAGMLVPADWPSEMFDLIVLSEVLDYLSGLDLGRLAARLAATLSPGGDVLLVHWLGKKGDRPPQATESSEVLIDETRAFLRPILQERNKNYRLDCLSRVD